jgi:hypothetical protein
MLFGLVVAFILMSYLGWSSQTKEKITLQTRISSGTELVENMIWSFPTRLLYNSGLKPNQKKGCLTQTLKYVNLNARMSEKVEGED